MRGLRRLWGCYSACAVVVMSLQILSVALVVTVVLGVGFVHIPILSDVVAPRPRTAAAPAEDRPGLLAEKWRQAAMSGPDIQMEISESEVNQIVTALSAREPTPLHEMRVEIRETQVRVGGRLPGPLPIGAEVWGRIEVHNGTMQLVAERVYSGNLELPQVMAEPFVAWANDQFRRPLVDKKIPLSVDGVELRERLAVVRGKVPQGWRPAP